ncbi:MAG: alpha-glucosidase family protein [Pseudomonadota bacterium]
MAEKRTAQNPDWWRGGVLYQIYPRSFQDTNGDGVGDLAGATERLDHIASLGVDAIWLSPFFRSPMADMGYDVSDYCDVDPMFGTLQDFDRFLEEAHRRGIKVIIDLVLSHTSDQHAWFRQSRASRDNDKADWYVWADAKPDGTAPNNWLSIFGGPAWEWDTVRRQYYMHTFLASQPDLNFHNPAVRRAVLDTARFWLDRGVDGFRLDAVNHYFHDRKLRDNPPSNRARTGDVPETNPYGYQDHLYDKTQPQNVGFLKEFRALLNEYEGRAAVGEVGDGERSLKTVASYTEGGDKLNMCYTFDLLAEDFDPAHIRRCVGDFEATVKEGWVCWAFSNHDVRRHVSRFAKPGDDPDRLAKFALTLLACLRGSICLYQGEELGLEEAEIAFEDLRDPYGIRFWPGFKGRDGCRTPMPWNGDLRNGGFSTAKPWLPVPATHMARAADRQGGTGTVLAHYREMLAFRKKHKALASGSIRFVGKDKDVLAFEREEGDERLLCLFNFGREEQSWKLPTKLGRAYALDLPGLAVKSDGQHFALAPLGAAVLRIS